MIKNLTLCIAIVSCIALETTCVAPLKKSNRTWYNLYRPLLNKPWFSKSCGKFAKSTLSRHFNSMFVKKYRINMQEALEENPKKYASLNDLFIRKLKPDARQIAQNSIVSPADGSITVIKNLENSTDFLIKGVHFSLSEFVNNEPLTEKFIGGTAVIIYLAPNNYHRFHFPFDCIPNQSIRIDGKYESVSDAAYKSGIQPLTHNVRYLVELSQKCALIAVGAMCVGSVDFTYQPNTLQQKGSEMGYFSFGGSTIVLLFAKNSFTLSDELNSVLQTSESTPIQMGHAISAPNLLLKTK